MTSPLDGRIRAAVEAALSKEGSAAPVDVQQQITDLHEHLHEAMTKIGKLEYRIEFLEQGAQILERVPSADASEPVAPRRARRKSTEQ